MTKLAFAALAAGAAMIAAPACAQPPQGAPPPPPRMPPPGVSWHHGPMPGMHMGGHMRGHFPHRLQRGFIVPPFFFGPQFGIDDWQAYGFAAPGADQRWIRYYDDAYLIDRDGRVVDTRDGVDWDRYGDRWAMDGDMPYHEGGERVRTYVYGAPGYPPPPPPGYGYGGAYGSYGYYGGYGYAYPIIIETTVSGGGGGYVEEVTEELERVRAPRRVHHRPAPRCICRTPRAAAPSPPAPRADSAAGRARLTGRKDRLSRRAPAPRRRARRAQ